MNEVFQTSKRLGKLPAKSSPKALLLASFIPDGAPPPPKRSTFWSKRTEFPMRKFGNDTNGDCTIASQCVMALRLERLETRQTPYVADEEALRVYYAMTGRLYGGGDTGAYETDALDNWRREDLTFRDGKSRPFKIDAYTRINHLDIDEVKRAIALSAAHGIKVCFNLPLAWSRVAPPAVWDIPEGQALTGDWMPGSWGGHSLSACYGYTEAGVYVTHQWYEEGDAPTDDQLVTWRAFAAMADEAHLVIDSIDAWRKRVPPTALDVSAIGDAVNQVSSLKVKA